MSEGVSMKLWWLLWLLKGLRPTLNWNRYRRPTGSCTPKILLGFGRKNDDTWSLRLSKDGRTSKYEITLFQDEIAWGKKLFMYLLVLHFILRKTLYKKDLCIGGSLSLRYDGALLFMILWIWKMRLHIRRSDKVSHPNSSLSLELFEPCHLPITARAAWYWTISNFSIRELKVGSWGGGLIDGGMW